MKEHSYMAFLQEAKQFIPQERIYTDELRRLAWGTDAGFYICQIIYINNTASTVYGTPRHLCTNSRGYLPNGCAC